jgi:hypothetical protein
MLESLEKSLELFIALDGVVGITLNGGLSRDYGDYLSEIDVTIFLHEEQFSDYEKGNYPFALGITMIDGYLYDIKSVSFEQELKKDYESIALWDLSYAKILFDPIGEISDFIRLKLSNAVDISQASGFLWSAYWSYKLAGDIWIHRQDGLQGHFTLNNVINPLISALFIANKEYIPHEKWLVHMSKSLAWRPDDWEARLAGAMHTGDFSIQSLKDRQDYIDGLWHDINHKICGLSKFYSELDFTQKQSYETLINLLKVSEYTIEAWETVSSLDSLNYEPVHSIFKRMHNKVVLDKSSFLSLKPEDMYAWMYKIADEARKNFCSEARVRGRYLSV